jgi:hypothetical protein
MTRDQELPAAARVVLAGRYSSGGADGRSEASAQASPALPGDVRVTRDLALEWRRGDLGRNYEDGDVPRLLSRSGVDPGAAGASAAVEGSRRAARKVDEVRRKYGDHAAEVAREMAGRDAEATWGKGSEGESWWAGYTAREVGDGVIALHDRSPKSGGGSQSSRHS